MQSLFAPMLVIPLCPGEAGAQGGVIQPATQRREVAPAPALTPVAPLADGAAPLRPGQAAPSVQPDGTVPLQPEEAARLVYACPTDRVIRDEAGRCIQCGVDLVTVTLGQVVAAAEAEAEAAGDQVEAY